MQIFISFYFAFRPFFHFSHIYKPCNNLITFCDCIADWRIEKGNHHWRVVEGALRCLMPCKSAKTEIKSGLPCPATPSVEADGGLEILKQLCSSSQRLWWLVLAKLQIQKQFQNCKSRAHHWIRQKYQSFWMSLFSYQKSLPNICITLFSFSQF